MKRKKPAKVNPPLKAIGYWGPESVQEGTLPDPASLVAPLWLPQERSLIASYLRAGQVFASYRGWAVCRLCPDGERLGTTDLTDGEWVWPARLEHYVEDHDIRLPDEFIGAMRRRSWQVPGDPDRDWEEDWRVPDYSLWVAWAGAVKDGAA